MNVIRGGSDGCKDLLPFSIPKSEEFERDDSLRLRLIESGNYICLLFFICSARCFSCRFIPRVLQPK